jgi:hypothetical protein
MKPLLRSFLFIVFVLALVQGLPLFALPGVITHATVDSVTSGAQLPAPVAPIPPELRNQADPDLPVKGSPLPLISLIGFGLLIGGVVPALRAHKVTGTHQ